MTMGSVVQGEAAGLGRTLKAPPSFLGGLTCSILPEWYTPPSPNSVLKCEVSKVEDFRQPQPIGFVIQSLGLYVPGCQEVPGVH